MSVDDLLTRLESVKQRGNRYIASCPAHKDKSPSLAVQGGERGILLHCFAGCSLDAICHALGIATRDLFYDQTTDAATIRRTQQQREDRRRERERQRESDGLCIDALRESETLIASRCGIDVSRMSHDKLNDELNALADAYAILESENHYDE